MDFLRVQGLAHEGEERSPDHARFRPAGLAEFPSRRARTAWRSRLQGAIDADIAGQNSHAQALDADTSGQLRDIHRRVATAILFESSGGQTDKSAHLPELRFALGEPGIETTSIDTAANQMEARGFFIRRKGTDGYQFGFKPTLKKVVNDRRASLDEDEVLAETRKIVEKEFLRGKALPIIAFPEDGTAVQDTTRLSLVVLVSDAGVDRGRLTASRRSWSGPATGEALRAYIPARSSGAFASKVATCETRSRLCSRGGT